MNEREHHKRAVVIGASSGIGRAAAELLARSGFETLAIGRDERKLAELQAPVRALAADASDTAAMRRAFEDFGAFAHLVLTLSSSRGMGIFAELDLNEVRAGFDGKFWPFATALQQTLPLLDEHGSVTFVTAASAGGSMPGTAGLAAINAAIEAMIPVLAVELAPRRVNAVSPGVVDTAWWRDFPAQARDQIFAQYAARTTVGRIARAEDIADAVRFLVENPYVTNNVLHMDGGASLR